MAEIHYNRELNGIIIGDKIIQLATEADGNLEISHISPNGNNATFTGERDEVVAVVHNLEFSDE